MTTAIAFSAINQNYDVNGDCQRLVYEGVPASPGAIAWTQRLDILVGNSGISAPVRIAPYGASKALLQYDIGQNPSTPFTMWGYDGAAFSEEIFSYADGVAEPNWEEFDLHSTGRAVVLFSNYSVGYQIRVSTDRGQTWAAPITIDYLYNLINSDPLNDYSWYYAYSRGMSLQVDETTGIFYLLCTAALDTDTWEPVWFLLKSTNGTNWTLVKQWSYSELGVGSDPCSLAVSDSHIYAAFLEDTFGLQHFFVMCSPDGGATWAQATLSNPLFSFVSIISMAAKGSTAIAYTNFSDPGKPANYKKVVVVVQTTNGGSSWTETLRIDPYSGGSDSVYTNYPSVRASGSIFLVTFCGMASPWFASTWTAGGVVHDMSGPGQPFLCFWISTDSGATWGLEIGPIARWDESDNELYWQQIVDVSIGAVVLRGCFWPVLLLLADDIAPCVLEERPSTKCVPFGG